MEASDIKITVFQEDDIFNTNVSPKYSLISKVIILPKVSEVFSPFS